MKLSQAILKGCEMSKPCTGMLHRVDNDAEIYTCALGAAGLAIVGITLEHDEVELALEETYGQVLNSILVDPTWKWNGYQLRDAIVGMNDFENMPRETVAAWLDRLGL